jgi:hypothetical protein
MQGDLSQRLGGPLAVLNGAVAPDVLCVAVSADVQLEAPVHVIYVSSGVCSSAGLHPDRSGHRHMCSACTAAWALTRRSRRRLQAVRVGAWPPARPGRVSSWGPTPQLRLWRTLDPLSARAPHSPTPCWRCTCWRLRVQQDPGTCDPPTPGRPDGPWRPRRHARRASSRRAAPQVRLAEGAALRHGYVQLEAARGAAHTKSTFVQQSARSSYALTEACLGAQLARHDVIVEQVPLARGSARPS